MRSERRWGGVEGEVKEGRERRSGGGARGGEREWPRGREFTFPSFLSCPEASPAGLTSRQAFCGPASAADLGGKLPAIASLWEASDAIVLLLGLL